MALRFQLFTCLYLVVLAAVAVLTRATPRRIGGAVAGAAAAGVVALGMIAFGERAGWWHFAIPRDPYFLALVEIDFALCAFVFLLTWRIARRFGGRGLIVAGFIAAVIGPPRDYLVHENVSGVGRVRARDWARAGNLRDVRALGDRGARVDAVGRRACRGRSAGAPTLENGLILRTTR